MPTAAPWFVIANARRHKPAALALAFRWHGHFAAAGDARHDGYRSSPQVYASDDAGRTEHGAQVRLDKSRVWRLRRRVDLERSRSRGSVHRSGCDVIAMWAGSILASKWLPLPAVFVRKARASSTTRGPTCRRRALSPRISRCSGDDVTVEVFPRADGSTHSGFFGRRAVAARPASRRTEPGRIERLRRCERLSPAFRQNPDHREAGLLPSDYQPTCR